MAYAVEVHLKELFILSSIVDVTCTRYMVAACIIQHTFAHCQQIIIDSVGGWRVYGMDSN